MAQPTFQFCLVNKKDEEEFTEKVETLLNEGWQLHGGMIVIEGPRFIQALTLATPGKTKTPAVSNPSDYDF